MSDLFIFGCIVFDIVVIGYFVIEYLHKKHMEKYPDDELEELLHKIHPGAIKYEVD